MAFIPPIFTKLTIAQYMEVLYTKVHPNQWRNTDNMGRNSFMPLSMNVTKMIFTKLTLAWQIFIHNSYIEFYENPIYSFITDTTSKTDVVSTFTS
jgi:formylmethanofuran dehydrogenase subunit E-like metal-binding protein